MTRFVDEYLNEAVFGWPCSSSPRFSTRIVGVDSGDEQANRRWAHPLHTYKLPAGVRQSATAEAVRTHFMAMGGPFHTWPFRDPMDCASAVVTEPPNIPAVTMLDQAIGTGDGVTTAFQLVKNYTRGAKTYARPIHFPRTATVLVAVNGVLTAPASVSRPGGVVTFSAAPTNGHAITAGFVFDVQVRFEGDDTFDSIAQQWGVKGFADIPLVEVRYRP